MNEPQKNLQTVFLLAAGMGNPSCMTIQAREILESCQVLIGSKRILEPFLDLGLPTFSAFQPEQIGSYLLSHPQFERAAVLFSGDVGFYSGARLLAQTLSGLPGMQVQWVCGISSPAYLCARLGMAWEDVFLMSLHGRESNWLGAVASHAKTFLLTGGSQTVTGLCQCLCQHGFADVMVHVGERLSYPDERITTATAGTLSNRSFAPLSVMLVENPRAGMSGPVTHGLDDSMFVRGRVPMTKSEVRSVSLSKLQLYPEDIVYDIGAGTGSVSVEIARQIPYGAVYAIERHQEALSLLRENRSRFGVPNLHIISGSAPQALAQLPAPDRVFLGGTGGGMELILSALLDKNPKVRVVLNAVTLETLTHSMKALQTLGFHDPDILQLSVAKAKQVGGYHMMQGQNPIYILAADGPGAIS